MADEPTALPRFPGGPDPSQPIPRDPIEGFSLERYVDVSARLAEGNRPRDEIFAESALTERSWARVELGWLLRVATSLLQGDKELVLEFDRLYVAAQDALGPTDPTMPLDRYAVVVAKLEAGRDPVEVFDEHGLTLASAARLQRAWTRRLAQDPGMVDAFREMVKGARLA